MQENQKPKKQFHNYVVFSGIAFQMGVTIVVFSLIGVWLDKKFVINHSIFTVIFSLIGVFASLYTVIKQVIEISNDSKNEK